jgi:hypothetical protein
MLAVFPDAFGVSRIRLPPAAQWQEEQTGEYN